MRAMLELALLGPPQVCLNGQTLTGFKTRKALSLLFYLAVTRQPQGRAHLAGLLWGDMPEERARVNLSKALSELRSLLGEYVDIERRQVAFARQCDYWLDLNELEVAANRLNTKQPLTADDISNLYADATRLYRGEFLHGFEVQDAPDFELWMLSERGRRCEQIVGILSQVVTSTIEQSLWSTGIEASRYLLSIEPWREETHRHLMFLLARQGQRAAALAQYDVCRQLLMDELGVEPDVTTSDLYARIRAGEVTADGNGLGLSRLDRPNGNNAPSIASHTLSHLPSSPPALPQNELHESVPFVGRTLEWQQLLATWQQTVSGRSKLIVVQGEAGIGKTRLCEELVDWVARQGFPTATTRSYAAEGSLAYAPIVEWLRSRAVYTQVTQLDAVWQTEIARLLPEMLSQNAKLPHPAPLTEPWQRRRLFEALARAVAGTSQPKLLFFDDLQWCDQETLEWLRFLLRFDAAGPLLLVATVRSGETTADHPLEALMHELTRGGQVTTITLTPFAEGETRTLAQGVNGEALSEEEAHRLFEASEGNPLFVVEMIRAGYHQQHSDERTNPQQERAIVELPNKVHAVIQTRLSRLSASARSVVDLAATLGRSFNVDVLLEAGEVGEGIIADGLDELWRRQLVRERDVNCYDFSHDRIRDVAYAGISPIRRRLLHRRAAQVLERLHANELDAVSGDLARHHREAGQVDSAIYWHERAAQTAGQLHAISEAISHCRSALQLLHTLPNAEERKQHELRLLLALAVHIRTATGFTDHDQEETLRRAHKLATDLQDDDCILTVLDSLAAVVTATGRCKELGRLVDEAMRCANKTQNPLHQIQALWLQARFARFQGDSLQVEAAAEQASVLYRNQDIQAKKDLAGSCDWIDSDRRMSRWLLGYPDQALDISKRYLSTISASGSIYARSLRPFLSLLLYRGVGAFDLMAPLVEQFLSDGDKYDLPLSRGTGSVFRGWELAHQGRLHEGIEWTRNGVNIFRAMNHTMFQTHRLAMLAEMLLWAQQWEEAEQVLDEALSISIRADDHFWDVELHRLRGDLHFGRDALMEEAELSYQRAIEIAQRQHAKSLELRATMALCRLWHHQGKTKQAHRRLADLYNWFTEGFDTYDLRTARVLLAQLNGQ